MPIVTMITDMSSGHFISVAIYRVNICHTTNNLEDIDHYHESRDAIHGFFATITAMIMHLTSIVARVCSNPVGQRKN